MNNELSAKTKLNTIILEKTKKKDEEKEVVDIAEQKKEESLALDNTEEGLEELNKSVRQYLSEVNVLKGKLTKSQRESLIEEYIKNNIDHINIKGYVNKDGEKDVNGLLKREKEDILDYSIINDVYYDESVNEIRSNGAFISIERDGEIEQLKDKNGNIVRFTSPSQQMIVINKMTNGEKQLTPANPLINCRTMEGYRLSATHESAITKTYNTDYDGYCAFTLRKFNKKPMVLKDLIKRGTISDGMATFMTMIVRNFSFVTVGKTNSGKSICEDTKIITPLGYKLAKDIKIGDIVYDGNGDKTEIIGVYPQGKLDVYRITFDDETYIDVSLDHINRVYIDKKEQKDMLTKELIEYFKKNNTYNQYIKRPMNIEHKQKEYTKIVSIAKEKYEECICFEVDSQDHTYLVNDFIPTHNTVTNRAMLEDFPEWKRLMYIQEPPETDLRKFDEKGNQINDVIMLDADSTRENGKDNTNTMINLIKHALRNSPEAIGINEIRSSQEHAQFFIALQKGHECNTSFHSFDGETAIITTTNEITTAINGKYDVVLEQVCQFIPFVITTDKMEDRTRKVIEIAEVKGVKDGKPDINIIYQFNVNKKDTVRENGRIIKLVGEHKKVGMLSEKTKKKLFMNGYSEEAISKIDYSINSEETYSGKYEKI